MKIGIDLGGSHIAIGVVDSNGRIEEKIEKRLLKKDKINIEESVENYIIENVEKLKKKYNIRKIGISVPGTVSKDKIVKSVNLNIYNYEIVKKLEKKLKIPITIRNDAKCAALAENKYGCLKKYKRSVFLSIGTGIGGAVIIDNKLLDTGELPGCEFGHMIIEKEGKLCNCGNFGCFEKYASMKAFKDEFRKEFKLDENTSGKDIINIIRKEKIENSSNYKKIERLIKNYTEDLAIGISNLINIFEPEAIGIGGSFIYFEDIFLNELKKRIQDGKLFNPRKELIIEMATLENDAGIIGATI